MTCAENKPTGLGSVNVAQYGYSYLLASASRLVYLPALDPSNATVPALGQPSLATGKACCATASSKGGSLGRSALRVKPTVTGDIAAYIAHWVESWMNEGLAEV
ncbi:hypothetical protein N7478_000760 [Penicillium angulare]|uniref:uncharacterized protein n=1 Tax=Penicillium angulare TaxID=116970 RepID=UPI002540F270|nr:uncharacterized protein N7478_000760 [Penicillium angulare]KAJ5291509.1 hypothetical protein N7478_000760 [Penicillium angulare]